MIIRKLEKSDLGERVAWMNCPEVYKTMHFTPPITLEKTVRLSLKEESMESFVRSMCESESKQLLLTANFIKKDSWMLRALQAKDWTTFAKCYNGPAYAQNSYGVKLEAAYRKYSS